MAPRWFEKAEDELEAAYERGDLSLDEFRREMRELTRDLRDEAAENARDAYDETFW